MVAGSRSDIRIVYFAAGVTSGVRGLPSTCGARPGRCPGCGEPSRPAGGRLGLHGHGTRERQQWGPPAPDRAPILAGVVFRRYRCRHCRAVIAVLPRGPLRGKLYAAGAVGLALALLGCARLPPGQVRGRVSPLGVRGVSAPERWPSLRRWIREAAAGLLFPGVRPPPAGATARQLAERVASSLAARAPPGLEGAPIAARAFAGAAM